MHEAGLEPARPYWTLEPESSESANSTTRAEGNLFQKEKLVRLTGLEPTRRIDTSTSSWPVYQFQHSRKHEPPKKDCLIIIAIPRRNVNQKSQDFSKIFPSFFFAVFSIVFSDFFAFFELFRKSPGEKSFSPGFLSPQKFIS